MDEMERAFNLTTTALIDTIRIADERDIKQNEKISTMEKRIEKLQQDIETLDLILIEQMVKRQQIIVWL